MGGRTQDEKGVDNHSVLWIYTDSSKSSNSNVVGMAFVVVEPISNKKLFESAFVEENITNNQGELLAIKEAIKFARELNPDRVVIYSDSLYAVRTLNKEFVPKANKYIINSIFALLEKCNFTCSILWVRGHNGNKWNEEADRLAKTIRSNYE